MFNDTVDFQETHDEVNFGVYIIECEDGSYYTGASASVRNRLKAHFGGYGARHTQVNKPEKVIFWLGGLPDMKAAMRAEAFIKSGGRGLKDLLATGNDAFRYVVWRYATYNPPKFERKKVKKVKNTD